LESASKEKFVYTGTHRDLIQFFKKCRGLLGIGCRHKFKVIFWDMPNVYVTFGFDFFLTTSTRFPLI
jgi:hypothetical protein